ncbi:MAG: hypothetical protein H6Q75_159 [Firmicutes bacterium]|nr:hypothetical protein [Bacillota bacterium]
MRKWLWAVLFVLLWVKPAAVFAEVSRDTIFLAQEYGCQNSVLMLDDFFRPWTVYEEGAIVINSNMEQACFFTPFLLLASDARDKILAGKEVSLAEGKKVLEPYKQYLVFRVTLFGKYESFADGVQAVIRQGTKTIPSLLVYVIPEPEKSHPVSGVYSTKLFIYIMKDQVNRNKTAVLNLVTNDRRKHNFIFALDKFR